MTHFVVGFHPFWVIQTSDPHTKLEWSVSLTFSYMPLAVCLIENSFFSHFSWITHVPCHRYRFSLKRNYSCEWMGNGLPSIRFYFIIYNTTDKMFLFENIKLKWSFFLFTIFFLLKIKLMNRRDLGIELNKAYNDIIINDDNNNAMV